MVDISEFLSPQELEELNRPSSSALGLPGRVYSDPDFLELERRTLFRHGWVAVAVASEIPEPGDVLPVDVAGSPLALARDRDGNINCFHNVCRHRGAAVVTEPASKRAVLRCPWHGWTYELDGTLKGTPEFGGVGVHEIPDLDRSCSGLLPVRTGQWFDLVFVNIAGDAAPLEEFLSSFIARYGGFGFEHAYHGGSWSTTYPCNWKIAVESGIEDYHLPFLHPAITNGSIRSDLSVVDTDPDCYFSVYEVSEKQWAEGRGANNLPKLPLLPGLTGPDAHTLFFMNIFPSAVMGITPDSLYVGIWLPDGVERTSLTFHHYFVDEGAADELYQPTRDFVIENVREVFSQDVPVVKRVQQRASGRDELDIRTRFSPFWETAVHQFQKLVVKSVAGNLP